jgi:hypothetical protein
MPKFIIAAELTKRFNSYRLKTFPVDPANHALLQFHHNVHFYSTFEKEGGSASVVSATARRSASQAPALRIIRLAWARALHAVP